MKLTLIVVLALFALAAAGPVRQVARSPKDAAAVTNATMRVALATRPTKPTPQQLKAALTNQVPVVLVPRFQIINTNRPTGTPHPQLERDGLPIVYDAPNNPGHVVLLMWSTNQAGPFTNRSAVPPVPADGRTHTNYYVEHKELSGVFYRAVTE